MPPVDELRDARIIFVLGGPGSGKGTQCAKLVEKYGFTHLSTGDLLRDELKSGSDRAKELEDIMKRGELVSLETVLTLLKEAILKHLDSKGFLIDGYPREVDQGIRFEDEVGPVESVIYFEVSDETMKKRLMHRGETSGRVDDTDDVIIKRLKTFHDVTEPVVEHYSKQNKVFQINAEDTIDNIFEKVDNFLSGRTVTRM